MLHGKRLNLFLVEHASKLPWGLWQHPLEILLLVFTSNMLGPMPDFSRSCLVELCTGPKTDHTCTIEVVISPYVCSLVFSQSIITLDLIEKFLSYQHSEDKPEPKKKSPRKKRNSKAATKKDEEVENVMPSILKY